MEPITRRTFLRVPLLTIFSHAFPQTLYTQSLQTQLTRTSPNLEFLVRDLVSQQVLASTFAPNPIPPGSLLKPFLALAYLTEPHPAELQVACRGQADRCWKAHGVLTLPEAIAQSCNAYFLALARTLDTTRLTLPSPPNPTPEDLIGLTARWLISPHALALAYADLLTSPATPRVILEGMRLSAIHGTASGVGPHPGGVLAKTGTAPCVPAAQSPCKASGDGLVLAAVPAEDPKLLLLLRRRATNGATAAQSASRVLTQLKAFHAY